MTTCITDCVKLNLINLFLIEKMLRFDDTTSGSPFSYFLHWSAISSGKGVSHVVLKGHDSWSRSFPPSMTGDTIQAGLHFVQVTQDTNLHFLLARQENINAGCQQVLQVSLSSRVVSRQNSGLLVTATN